MQLEDVSAFVGMIETDVSDKSPSILCVSDTENARHLSASADGEVCIHVLDVHLMRVGSRNSASSAETEAPLFKAEIAGS